MSQVSPQADWVIGEKQISPYAGKCFIGVNPDEVPSVYSLMIRYVICCCDRYPKGIT